MICTRGSDGRLVRLLPVDETDRDGLEHGRRLEIAERTLRYAVSRYMESCQSEEHVFAVVLNQLDRFARRDQ